MRISGPRHVAVATVGLGLFVGCATYNTLYDAEALYREAEDLRLTGRDSAVRERYREVVARATKGYESDEDGVRADDALGAAEIARDGLAARRLSAALFQAYADAAPDGQWYTKALLAARELTTDPAERERLDERVDEELIARQQFAGAPRE